MKISFLTFYGGQIDRGVEVATEELARGLSKHHEVTVFQTGERVNPKVPTIRLPLDVRWDTIDFSGTWQRKLYLDYWSKQIFQFTLKFLPYFWRYKYDVVIPTNGGWQVILCRLVSWILRKKLIVQGNAGIGYDDLFQLHCFPDRYIAISPHGYEWAKRFAPWVKKQYTPYGVDADKFQHVKPIKLPLKKPVVLCVAAFSPYKRIDLLIKAIGKVPDVSLLVIGHGPLKNELRELGDQMLGKRFLLKTGIDHDELIGYYKAANAFSLPSRSTEALGIVYIEAMAAGLPIVAPDDWRREIIGEAGVYVNPEDTDSYAKAITLALAKDFGDVPIKQAEKFDWDKIVTQYEEILSKL